MSHMKKFIISIFLCLSLICLSVPNQIVSAYSSSPITFVILSDYKATADIGDQFYIIAITSTGKKATWKSSDSKIASVNTYGMVTAKKYGTATITAKIKDAEASCNITVNKTKISISNSSASIERNETLKLSATTSNNSAITWKSNKKSVATIDEYGTVTGMKPGEAIITASSNGTSETCKITVKPPTVKLNKTKVTLFRGQTAELSATVSSNVAPKWKTNKKSVAVVDENGIITAVKNGTATITATVDGVSKTCEITVKKPEITLSASELNLKIGDTATVTAKVSSGNSPVWSTSNSKIISIGSNGKFTTLKEGTAYIYASEDGTKVRCTIRVTE